MAPLSCLEVCMLDPRTLAVLDLQHGCDGQKRGLIELSVVEAVRHSEIGLRTAPWKSGRSAKSIRRARRNLSACLSRPGHHGNSLPS
jgi:hypothetical protein